MHAETLPAAKPIGCPWVPKTLTLLVAAFALLANREALAQKAGFTVGTNLIDISQQKGNETDPSIAINPLNPSNMVMVAATDGTNGGLFLAYTTNLGGIWTSNFIATNGDSQGLNPAGGPFTEPSAAFDAYGNLFLAYLPSTFLGVATASSTNGGKTFSFLTNLASLDVTDQPRITAPPAGAAAGSVWVVYKDYTSANSPLQVQGLLSTANGIGTFGIAQAVPGSSDGGFADISVGPFGQVLVAFQDNLEGTNNGGSLPTANIFVSVETNAIADGSLSYNAFGPANLVASDAIGGVTYLDAAPSGIGVNAAPGLGWDYDLNDATNFDNVYLIYTAVGPNGNAVIGFNSSSDYGTNAGSSDTIWNGESYVDDDAVNGFDGAFNDHFLPRVAVDPVSGIVACSWYDCRNDQGASSQTITNVVKTVFTNTVSMITNVNVTGTYLFETNTTKGSNITVIIVAQDLTNTMMTSDGITNVYLDNSNFDIMLDGTNTGSTVVTVILSNIITTAYTSGNGANQEAIPYETISTNGGGTFEANQQLISAKQAVIAPATGLASTVAGSDGLTGWGHYTALAAYGASFFPVWPDNSDVTTNNPDGAGKNFDIYMINSGPGGGGGNVVPYADLTIFVTNSPNPVTSQEVITYSVIVTNRGTATAPAPVIVTNILSPYVTLLPNSVVPALGGAFTIGDTTNGQEEIVFTLPAMTNGAVLTNTFRVSASVSSIATNFATVYSGLLDLVPANTSNTLILLIEGEDLAMGMTASETNILIGDTVISTVTVTNLGPATNGPVFITNYFSTNWTNVTVLAQGTNQVTNSSSGQIAIVNLGLLASNQSVTATFFAVALSGSTSASESAFVGSQDIDTNLANNSNSLSFFVNDEDLALGMTSSSSNVDQGVPFTYALSVTNFGLSYSGLVTVTNFISTNLGQLSTSQSQGSSTQVLNQGGYNQVIFNLGTLGAGQIATMTITAVPLGLPVPATNIAVLSSTDFDTNLANNVVTNVVAINGEDLAIGLIPSSAFVDLGQPITYTIKVDNLGASYDGMVTVTDAISTNLGQLSVTQTQGSNTVVLNQGGFNQVVFNLGSVGVGQTAILTVSAIALSGPSSSTNIATVSDTDFDLNLSNNAATSLVTVNDEDLAIGVTASSTSAQVGQTVTFSESVTNLGLSTNGVVLVTNTFSTILGTITVLQPATGYTLSGSVVTFNLGTLNAGQIVPITITAIATGAGSATDTVKVGSLSFDTNAPNNTAKATVTVTVPAISNLTVTALASSAFIVFDTSAPATDQAQYGLTTSYGNVTSVSATATTHHVILLTGLTGETNYDFEALAFVGTTTLTKTGSFFTTNTIILNTSDARYMGSWTEGIVAPGIYENGFYQYSPATNFIFPTASATYAPAIPAAGLYNVSIWYPADPSFTTNAQVAVTGGTNAFTNSVNQTVNGGSWQPLATNMYFARGTNGTVILYNNTRETNKFLVANAMRWVYDAAQDYPVNGSVPAWWANFYFGTNVNGSVNGSATASNGYSIYANYVLGTNPTNAASGLSLIVTPASSNEVSVTFSPYQGGRDYQLQIASDLSVPVWTTLTNAATSANGVGMFTVASTNAGNAFYRLSAYIIP